ncbi:STAS domain-containing protein [Streptomyces sp. WSLK1-3]|uniref:STAS domain-containing protein n=1 Tax=Streptomyces sp. WSLK1-3 TaxID=3375475 RepID=UPI0037B40014
MPESAHTAQSLATLEARPRCLATIRTQVAGERTVVTCRGELDTGAHVLRPELYAALDRSVTGLDLDLGEVAFCDCGGLNVLLDLRREALDQGKTVTVRTCGPTVGRLLDLTGARELFASGRPGSPDGSAPDAEVVPGPEEQLRRMHADRELRLDVDQLRRTMRSAPRPAAPRYTTAPSV